MNSYLFSDWKEYIGNILNSQKIVSYCDDKYLLCWKNNILQNEISSNSLNFEDWKLLIDKVIYIQTGYHCDNLPDYDYWGNWNKICVKKEDKEDKEDKKDKEDIINNFEDWKLYIDKEVYNQTGYHCDNLPDYDYWVTWHKMYIKKEEVIEDIINNLKNE